MSRHSSADIALPAIISTGEGDLLSIKGDLAARSTEVDDDPGDCGSCGDAEEEEDEPRDIRFHWIDSTCWFPKPVW